MNNENNSNSSEAVKVANEIRLDTGEQVPAEYADLVNKSLTHFLSLVFSNVTLEFDQKDNKALTVVSQLMLKFHGVREEGKIAEVPSANPKCTH